MENQNTNERAYMNGGRQVCLDVGALGPELRTHGGAPLPGEGGVERRSHVQRCGPLRGRARNGVVTESLRAVAAYAGGHRARIRATPRLMSLGGRAARVRTVIDFATCVTLYPFASQTLL